VIGPVCASEAHDGGTNPGARGTSPKVGLKPNTPQNDEDTRIEPTPSVPMAIDPQPAATAAAAPPLDPPLVRPGFQGLPVKPETGLSAVSFVARLAGRGLAGNNRVRRLERSDHGGGGIGDKASIERRPGPGPGRRQRKRDP
jgi:hypothetical protein